MISFDEALACNDARLLAHPGTAHAPLSELEAKWAERGGMAVLLLGWAGILTAGLHEAFDLSLRHMPDYTNASAWGCAALLGLMCSAISFDIAFVHDLAERAVARFWGWGGYPFPLGPHQVRWMIDQTRQPGTMAGEAAVRWLAHSPGNTWTEREWQLLRSWQRKRDALLARQREYAERDARAREAIALLEDSGLSDQARALKDREALSEQTRPVDPPKRDAGRGRL